MDTEKATKIVSETIKTVLADGREPSGDMPLIGTEALLDSMKLVELCLALEDTADTCGFEFDWTSTEAMSKSRSMFRSVSALAEEFARQSEV